MPGDPQRPMFDPLMALERFLDCPRHDTDKSNGCRCSVGGICWVPSEKIYTITSLVLSSRTFEGPNPEY